MGPAVDCAFGVALWCLAQTAKSPGARESRIRIEAFAGYKPSNLYYQEEIAACTRAGCKLRFDGPAFGLDAFYRLGGDPHGDDYFDLGLSTSYMPILTGIERNPSGFDGELGRVAEGDGGLAYVPVRIALRRPNFLYLVKSKYLISAFGVGAAFPVTRGAGATFPGGDGPKVTIGGRLGAQLPVTEVLKIGIATSWSVIWYGASFGQASFQTSYGINVSYQL